MDYSGVIHGACSFRKNLIAAVLTLGLVNPLLATEPVDINSADATALADAIDGVGMKRAQAIIDYRTMHGPFKNVEELANVRGIGERTVTQSRERLVAH